MTKVNVNTAVSNAALKHLVMSAMETELDGMLKDLMENYLPSFTTTIDEGLLEETFGVTGDGVEDIIKEIVRECYVELTADGFRLTE